MEKQLSFSKLLGDKISCAQLIICVLIYGVVCFYISQFIGVNTTYSEPRGYYLYYTSTDYAIGDQVLICLENNKYIEVLKQLKIMHFATNRCKSGLPYLVKTIIAKTGDNVTINGVGIMVNGHMYPNSKVVERVHGVNLLPQAFGSYKLTSNQFFVLGSSKNSYDSRYFGVVYKNQIKGKALFLMPLISS